MSDTKLTNPQFSNLRGAIPVVNENGIRRQHSPIPAVDSLNKDPNQKKNYIVIVKRGLTIDNLEHDLERDTSRDKTVDSNIVPDRKVEVANRRPGSERQTHYWLTDEEAMKLKNHPMVEDVEWDTNENPFVQINLHSKINQNFERAGLFGPSGGDRANFGLYRCSNKTNTYNTGTAMRADYNYVLDGTGVDVIIMDNGVLTNHPEWEDSKGNSRFQEIDWYAAAGISGTMPVHFYDYSGGHATHVAGIIAGKTFGWAKNAKIYSMNTLGDDPISSEVAFDLMKLFHRNKPVNPATGQKRPTIVNASWGQSRFILSSGGNFNPYQGIGLLYVDFQIWGGNYRGNNWSGYVMHPSDYALKGVQVSTVNNESNTPGVIYQVNNRSSAIDALVQDLIDEGIHFIHSAGNSGIKSDAINGADYNNYVNILTGINGLGQPVLEPHYYNRGGSPTAIDAINVGSIDADAYSSTLENRAFYSEYGSWVDIWAPGTGIVSAYDGTGGSPYYYDNTFNQENDSGTSMSSPQVAGVLALFAQLSPGVNPIEAKKWVTNNAITGALYDTGLITDYASDLSLGGGPNKFLFNPYAVSSIYAMKNGIVIKDGIVNLKS